MLIASEPSSGGENVSYYWQNQKKKFSDFASRYNSSAGDVCVFSLFGFSFLLHFLVLYLLSRELSTSKLSMSSMRNAVQRRNHKERGQLQGREKWGLLEKHKVSS